jgi:hypothetical protein
VNQQAMGREAGSAPSTARRTGLRASHRLPVFAGVVLVLEAVVFAIQPGRNITPFLLVLIPATAAVLVSAASGGRPEVKGLIGRMSVWRVRPRWYLAALGLPVAEKLAVDISGSLLGFAKAAERDRHVMPRAPAPGRNSTP